MQNRSARWADALSRQHHVLVYARTVSDRPHPVSHASLTGTHRYNVGLVATVIKEPSLRQATSLGAVPAGERR